jgi:hypothetical protein
MDERQNRSEYGSLSDVSWTVDVAEENVARMQLISVTLCLTDPCILDSRKVDDSFRNRFDAAYGQHISIKAFIVLGRV